MGRFSKTTLVFAALVLCACGGGKATAASAQLDVVSVPLRADAPDVLRAFISLCSLAAEDGFEAAAASAEAKSLNVERSVDADTQSLTIGSFGGQAQKGGVNVDPVKTSCTAFLAPDQQTADATAYVKALDGLDGFRGKLQTVSVGLKSQLSGFYNGAMTEGRVIVLSGTGSEKLASITMIVGKIEDLK